MKLLSICPEQVKEVYYLELSPNQQFQIISCFLSNQETNPDSIQTIPFSFFFSFKQPSSYWLDCNSTLLLSLFSYQSILIHQSIKNSLSQDLSTVVSSSSVLFFYEFLHQQTGCSYQVTSSSPSLQSFIQANSYYLSQEGILLSSLLFPQFLLSSIPSSSSSLFLSLAQQVYHSLHEQLTVLSKRLEEIDESIESVMEFQSLAPFCGLAIDIIYLLYQEINKNEKKAQEKETQSINTQQDSCITLQQLNSIKTQLSEILNQIIHSLKQLNIHSIQGLSCWLAYYQLYLTHYPSSSLTTPFFQFFSLLCKQILSSSSLLLFQQPLYNEIFRYNLYQSTTHNDLLLLFFFQQSFFSSLFSSSELSLLLISLFSQMSSYLPSHSHRSYLSLALTQLCLIYQPQSSLLTTIINNRESSDLSWLFVLHYLQIHSSELSTYQSILLPLVPSIPLQLSSLSNQWILQFFSLFYPAFTKKELLPWLFFIIKTILFNGHDKLQQQGISLLQAFSSTEENSSLLNSFIQSYLKREWKMEASFFLPAFSFLHSMIDFLPSLSPFLFCINLFSYQTSLSLPILSYLSHRVPFLLFNDLHYSLDTNQFDLYCNNNTDIEKAILGSYLYILLCQVISFFLFLSRMKPVFKKYSHDSYKSYLHVHYLHQMEYLLIILLFQQLNHSFINNYLLLYRIDLFNYYQLYQFI